MIGLFQTTLNASLPRGADADRRQHGWDRRQPDAHAGDPRHGLGRVEGSNARALLAKEIGIASLNGVLWAVVVALLAVVCSATGRSAASSARPFSSTCFSPRWRAWWCRWCSSEWGIDPALAGGVILTTVTDVIGFFCISRAGLIVL